VPVKFSRRAERDLLDIYLFGDAEFGTAQAEKYRAGLDRVFDLLAENPRLARERLEFRNPVRLHAYQSHVIAYRIVGRHILIVRVLHGHADWGRHL
jgi:toxin ParE1/3/4